MAKRITREEFLNLIFSGKYDELRQGELRLARVRVPGKEVCLAQIIGVSQVQVSRLERRALDRLRQELLS